MNLGVQYYRAPFPDVKYWEEDFRRIRACGLNTVQLWISWGWVEAKPEHFRYDDYDRLVELAAKNGLGVVLSTIAEIHPNWIHRVIPDCELVDQHGNKIKSVGRCEHHFGLTPGGCSDHPEVWRRMALFIENTGRRYASLDNLRGWDVWNELRWEVHADATVCYCDHTLARFRQWLADKYGSLEGLNEVWKRRYDSWEDVMPGRAPDQPYTEMMAFQEFITWRANDHGRRRYEVMKSVDSVHPVTAHAADPSPMMAGFRQEFAIVRGNDWDFADTLDGIGCSSFPQWQNIDDADFGMRIDMVRSAAPDKPIWLSELQGGRAAVGFNIFGKVEADHQQRWIWNGLASGANTILFWCWRDEVFGRESAGFGLAGSDGLAPSRLAAMKITGGLLEEQAELFDQYRAGKAAVGVYFSPRSYYLGWAQEGSARRMVAALTGYGRALTRRAIPCTFIEAGHPDALKGCRVLFLPHTVVLSREEETALLKFVEEGGTLFCESECGAFDPCGFYRYPEDRLPARVGIKDIGRRILDKSEVTVALEGRSYRLRCVQWRTPAAETGAGEWFAVREHGRGRVICFAGYLGEAYRENPDSDFEQLLADVVAAAGVEIPASVVSPAPEADKFIYLKCGSSGGRDMMFVFFPPEWPRAEIRLNGGFLRGGEITELFSGRKYRPDERGNLVIEPGRFNIAILVGGKKL